MTDSHALSCTLARLYAPASPRSRRPRCRLALQVGSAWAVEPFVLKDIRVEGLQRTDAGTVFAALPFRIGDTYTDEKGAAALRALFATGLFKDVRIDIDGGVVVVIVDERAVIASIDFVGLKEFDKDALIKSLKDFGIGEGLPFDKALADRAEQELKRQYLTRSLYGAEVVTTVTPHGAQPRQRHLHDDRRRRRRKISEIRIVGNKVFSEGTLKGLFELNDGGWLNLVHEERPLLARQAQRRPRDAARLLPEPRLPRVRRSNRRRSRSRRDKQDISITINVKEGQPYTVTGVQLEGDYLGKEDDFKTLVHDQARASRTAPRTWPRRRAPSPTASAPSATPSRASTRGPRSTAPTARWWSTLVAEPQRRVYVRRINVAGNTRTRDEVVRREFRQFESAWYDGRKIKLSRDRVDRLGYFSEVNVETNEVPGSPDQVDLTITVKEKPTGNLLLGAGFS